MSAIPVAATRVALATATARDQTVTGHYAAILLPIRHRLAFFPAVSLACTALMLELADGVCIVTIALSLRQVRHCGAERRL